MKPHKTSKPEKILDKNHEYPILHHPFLKIQNGEGKLLCSDGTAGALLPVEVSDEDTQGPVHIEAIKTARKTNAPIRCEAGYCVVEDVAAYPREDRGEYPAIDSLLVDDTHVVYEVALNIKTLYALAQTMGTDVVKLRLQADPSVLPIGVEPHPSEPHVHGARGALMPYRLPQSM